MIGMVFAAGLGTRLRPLTHVLPKPATPLMNRPLAAWSLERLRHAGVTQCAVNTFHLAEAAEAQISAHIPDGMNVEFAREATLLGTGGGIRNALGHHTAEEFIVMNGDIFFWPDLEAALDVHRRLGAKATMVLRADSRAEKLGAIDLDSDGRVRRLLGTPAYDGPLEQYMFTGVHVLSAAAVLDLPENGCVVRDGYRHWLDRGDIVAGAVDTSPWRDLGTPAEYLRAHLDLLRGTLPWPTFKPSSNLSAARSSAQLDEVVVGEGARFDPGVTLSQSVVWPGAHVRRSGSHCIITPDDRLQLDGELVTGL